MRHLYVGTTINEENNTSRDRLYVVTDDGIIWLMDLFNESALRVRHWTLEELATHFDKWRDLGTISDKVRINDAVKINQMIVLNLSL